MVLYVARIFRVTSRRQQAQRLGSAQAAVKPFRGGRTFAANYLD
jgi:hypothetical protein